MHMLNEMLLRMLVWQGPEIRLSGEKGQTLAEYGLILAVIAIAVVVTAVIAFRTAIINAFQGAVDCLDGSC